MKTVSSASSMPAYDYIQLDSSIVDFTTSSTDATPGDSVSTDIDAASGASVSGFVNVEYRGGAPDSDISVSGSPPTATAFDSDNGSQIVVHIAPENAQNDGNITDHFTGGGGFVSSADVVTVINTDILITAATAPDAGLIGDGNFAIVPDSTVDPFEPTATDDSLVVSTDATDSGVFLLSGLTDSTGNPESSRAYSDVYPSGSGSIVPDNSFVAGSALGFDNGALSAESAITAPSGALSSEFTAIPNPTYIYNAAGELHNSAAPSSSSEGSAPPSIMTFGDLGQSPASIVQTTSAAPGDASSGLVINITYDSSVANAPAGFEAVVASVVQFYESEFTNQITLNIDVGWEEIDQQGLLSGALGESQSYLESFSYSQIRSALIANATSSAQLSAVNSLPTSAPANGPIYLTLADATALGLLSSGTTLDGYVGFSNSFPFAYNNSNGVPAGEYDLYGVVAHELSEVMGRISLLDMSNSYSDLDLFRYSAPGVLSLVGTDTGYVSANGGNTALNYFNSNPSGDFGDWASSAGNDAYNAFSNAGVVNAVTQADLTVMNILGYDLGSQTQGTATFPLANANDVTEALYIGYYGSAGDPGGDSYWLSQLTGGHVSETGMAASFSVQPEATALYPFLASPSTASQAQITFFIESVYADLFDRAADSGGLAYWDNYLTTNLGKPQAVGAFILAVINGAQGIDQTTITNKVTVADYFTQELAAAGVSFTSAASTLAHTAIASVTSVSSTELAAESTISSWVTTTTQSTGAEVALVGTSPTSLLSNVHYI